MRGLEDALAGLAGVDVLLVAVDFDGTLAEIVDRPEDAAPVAGAVEALRDLAELAATTVVLISGRTIADLAQRIPAPPGVVIVGGHGAEWERATTPHPRLEEVATEVERLAARYRDAQVERKPASVTIHTRRMEPDQARELASDVADLGSEGGYRTETGKAVVEIHLTDRTKGTAIDELRGRCRPDAVLYLGDDTTDEEAFEALGGVDVGVKVGEGPTRARWRVAAPADAVEVLAGLAADRRRALAARGRR